MRALLALVLYISAGLLAVAVAAAALSADSAREVALPLLGVLAGLSVLLGYARPFAGALGPPLLVAVLAFWLFWLTGASDLETRGWGSAFLIGGLVAGELCVLCGAIAGSLVRGVRRLAPARHA